MAYLGNSPVLSQQEYRNIDDISGSFNGVTTSFALLVNGVAPIPGPQTSNQCLISVNGVIQKPDDTGASGFRISGGNIVFSSAPTGGQTFFGVILAGADYIYAGENFPDGTVSAPTITFAQDLDTGFYRSGAGEVKFTANGVNTVTFSSNGLTAPNFIPSGSSVPTNGVYLPSANNVAIATNSTQRLLIDSSGQIEAVSLGSAAAPTWSFTTDTNTGIYSPGADQVAISTGGSGRLFVDSTGRVGIGTSSPQELLDLYGTGNTTFRISGSSGGGGDVSQIDFFRIGSNVTSSIKAIRDGSNTSGALTFLTASSGTSTERLRIDASGRVGIGTSSPSRQLDVLVADNTTYAGNADNANALNLFNTSTTNETFSSIRLGSQGSGSAGLVTLYGVQTANAAGSGYFAIATRNAGTFAERFRITPGGNVGIGSTAPTTSLQIGSGSGLQQAYITGGGYDLYLGASGGSAFGFASQFASLIFNNTAVPLTIGTLQSQPLVFGTLNSERARIDSSGRFGIGTTSPGAALTVATTGTILSGTGNNYGFYVNPTSTGYVYLDALTGSSSNTSLVLRTYNNGTYNNVIQSISGNETTFSTAGTERARIDSSGRLLVGTSTATANGGVIQTSNGITFPATQSACTDANTLDDYEEGTFSPTAFGGTTAGTTTYGLQFGMYVKVGQICHYQVRISVTNMTGTGDLLLGGLPFTAINDVERGYGNVTINYLDSLPFGNAADTFLACYVNANSTNIIVRSSGNNRNSSAVPVDTAFTILYGGTYRTNT